MKYRLIILFLLGFSSGLPFCLVGSTLQAWFSSDGLSIMAVGMLGLIGQPYIYKFLWAPWMDRFTIGQCERRRGWIFLIQGALIIGLLCLSFGNPTQYPWGMAGLALLIAFFSASQDTVIDAYRAEILPEKERGLGAAFAVAGYRAAVLLSGGLALVIAQYWGWQLTYQCMAGLMLIGLLGNYCAPPVVLDDNSRVHKSDITLRASIKAFFQQNKAGQYIAFIFLYKLGEAFTATNSSLTIPFLIQGLGFDLATVGIVNKIGGITAMIIGSVIAGIVLLRMSLFRALLLFGIGQALSVLMFLGLCIIGKNTSMLVLAITAENMMTGMSTAALLALMMGLCQQRFTASHFALLSAIAALPRILAGPIGGLLQSHIGWTGLYTGVFFATWPSLFLLYIVFSPKK